MITSVESLIYFLNDGKKLNDVSILDLFVVANRKNCPVWLYEAIARNITERI